MVGVGDITLLLREVETGREGALDRLMAAVYADLSQRAQVHLRRQFGDRAEAITLEPAALVNESFMKLIRQRKAYDNRGQFFAIATRSMLRVLVDYRRKRKAAKRRQPEAGPPSQPMPKPMSKPMSKPKAMANRRSKGM